MGASAEDILEAAVGKTRVAGASMVARMVPRCVYCARTDIAVMPLGGLYYQSHFGLDKHRGTEQEARTVSFQIAAATAYMLIDCWLYARGRVDGKRSSRGGWT